MSLTVLSDRNWVFSGVFFLTFEILLEEKLPGPPAGINKTCM